MSFEQFLIKYKRNTEEGKSALQQFFDNVDAAAAYSRPGRGESKFEKKFVLVSKEEFYKIQKYGYTAPTKKEQPLDAMFV